MLPVVGSEGLGSLVEEEVSSPVVSVVSQLGDVVTVALLML